MYKPSISVVSQLNVKWYLSEELLLLQNLYSAQIQASSSRRRWCRWVGKWTSRGGTRVNRGRAKWVLRWCSKEPIDGDWYRNVTRSGSTVPLHFGRATLYYKAQCMLLLFCRPLSWCRSVRCVSACLCVGPDNNSILKLMTSDLDIWHAGSTWP